MLIDSHCHLPHNTTETELILKNALDESVTACINIGTTLEDNIHTTTIAEKFNNVYAAIAIYPNSNLNQTPQDLVKALKTQIDSLPKIVALGECGLDITKFPNQRPMDQQMELFERQIQLALRKNLPIIIHNRNGDEKIIELIKKYVPQGLRGVAHCFDGDWNLAKNFLDCGFYISFSGFITYNSKNYLLETVKKTPLNKILVETDAPYILPKGIAQVDASGAKILNEPKNVKIVALKVAETKNLPFEEIAETTSKNTANVFGLMLEN